MHPLHKQLQNSLTESRDARNRDRLIEAFPALQSCSDPHFLAIRRYLSSLPERLFDKSAYEIYLCWLQNRSKTAGAELKEYLIQYENEINRALLFIREINSEDWHDWTFGNSDEYDLVRFIDKRVHPTYLRLIEAVLIPLSMPIAYFSRLDRGKGTDRLDVWSVVKELEMGSAKYFVQPYEHIIRNGIAHGGIMFLEREIRYRDKKGNEDKFVTSSVVRIFDDLLDICNGLAAALKVFFLISRNCGYIPPQELLVEELQEETRTPWWKIEGCVESDIKGRSQLTVYARPETRFYSKVHWSTIQSGILAEYFAPGYDRYFFSLHSQTSLPGWAAFDGQKLRKLRDAGVNHISQYKGIVENDTVFYIARPSMPSLFAKLDTIAMSFRINMPIVIQNLKDGFGIPRIDCRNAAVHRNAWRAVLRAEVVIQGLNDKSAFSTICKYRRRITMTAMKHARRVNGVCGASYLPLGYAYIAVFRRDYRRRRLLRYGLDSDLVCTIRLQRIRRIKSPDILGSSVQTIGNWRIAWNKAWLDTIGVQFD